MALKVIRKTLKTMRYLTGSQCSVLTVVRYGKICFPRKQDEQPNFELFAVSKSDTPATHITGIAVVNAPRNKGMYQCFRTFFTKIIFSNPHDIVQVIERNRDCSCNMVVHRTFIIEQHTQITNGRL